MRFAPPPQGGAPSGLAKPVPPGPLGRALCREAGLMKLDLPSFAEQRVLVLGLGDSGLAMARWCAHFGAQVTVWDSREQPPQRAALGDTAAFITGALTAETVA